jgi:hypothetical protein
MTRKEQPSRLLFSDEYPFFAACFSICSFSAGSFFTGCSFLRVLFFTGCSLIDGKSGFHCLLFFTGVSFLPERLTPLSG